MRYRSPAALRMALGQLLRNKSQDSGISLDRLRRRVMYERIVSWTSYYFKRTNTWTTKGVALQSGPLSNNAARMSFRATWVVRRLHGLTTKRRSSPTSISRPTRYQTPSISSDPGEPDSTWCPESLVRCVGRPASFHDRHTRPLAARPRGLSAPPQGG